MKTVSPLHAYSEGMVIPSGNRDPGGVVDMHPSMTELIEPSSIVIWKVMG